MQTLDHRIDDSGTAKVDQFENYVSKIKKILEGITHSSVRKLKVENLNNLTDDDIYSLAIILDMYIKNNYSFSKGSLSLILEFTKLYPEEYKSLAKNLTGTNKIDNQGKMNISYDAQANTIIENLIYYISCSIIEA